MTNKRILSIQDISCVGQCSMTVALPIVSACGIETGILPSAILSTHTGGFSGFTVRDVSDDFPAIATHWLKEEIKFDAVYTGYLGSVTMIDQVDYIMSNLLTDKGLRIVDPAMGDNGKLYYGFDEPYAKKMAWLCSKADIILPNITEACFMTDTEYKTEYDEAYVLDLLKKLGDMGSKTIVLTGVYYSDEQYGVGVYDCRSGKIEYYFHRRSPRSYHGTGDCYASAFVGALMRGHDLVKSASIAADFVLESIEKTIGDDDHWYGVKFEQALPSLIEAINK